MSERYYCENLLAGDEALGSEVMLVGPEAHHLASVMRAQPGDRVALFDGRGNQCEASIVEIRRREVRLRVEQRHSIDRESAIDLTLAVALPKGDRQRWLVEKATELGVARLIPISTQRSVVRLQGSGSERLERFVIEACKQCGRNRLMEIQPPTAWEAFLMRENGDAIRLIAHPSRTDLQVRPLRRTDLEVRSTGFTLRVDFCRVAPSRGSCPAAACPTRATTAAKGGNGTAQ